MAGNKIIAICQLGGEFETGEDGSLSYKGGDAHAIDVDDQMKFNDFKLRCLTAVLIRFRSRTSSQVTRKL